MHGPEFSPPGDDSMVDTDDSREPKSGELADLTGNPEWAALLGYLREARGFDFHGYKPASLGRRISKRMEAVGLKGFGDYQRYLETNPGEFATLFNTILINVTGFFRDPAAWEAVRTEAIPRIIESKNPDDPIRAWSAGCATGEEAYTTAMLLAKSLGAEQFSTRVKIYATDLDEDALNVARHGAYTGRQIEGAPASSWPSISTTTTSSTSSEKRSAGS